MTIRDRCLTILPALALSIAACSPSPSVGTPDSSVDSLAVAAATTRFLGAFDSLDWEGFRGQLSEEVDAYWPRPDSAIHLQNRAAVEAKYHAFFERIRGARPGPPYLHLAVTDLSIRVLGDVGLVTFELTEVPDTLGRRTLVWHREDAGWRIVHLHASNLALTR